MVAVSGLFCPALGEAGSQLMVFIRLGMVATPFAQLGERAQPANRFGTQIDVVRQVPGEVIGAKLVFRVKALLLQVIRPLRKLFPIATGKIRVAFHVRHGGEQAQQIPDSSTGIWLLTPCSPSP